MKTEYIAQIAHEVNKVYCESIGDGSQPHWCDAPEWQRNSAVQGIEFTLANPDVGPAEQHKSWMDMKLADGWTYGQTKDAVLRRHPCLVPYDELPTEQQMKDKLFRAIVFAVVEL